MPELNIQDDFLKKMKNERVPVTVFLFNKVQLHGNITGYDKFIIMLESGGKLQMVFKHSVTTITPAVPMGHSYTRRPPSGGPGGPGPGPEAESSPEEEE